MKMEIDKDELRRIDFRRTYPGDRAGDDWRWLDWLDRVGWGAVALIVALIVALAVARECGAAVVEPTLRSRAVYGDAVSVICSPWAADDPLHSFRFDWRMPDGETVTLRDDGADGIGSSYAPAGAVGCTVRYTYVGGGDVGVRDVLELTKVDGVWLATDLTATTPTARAAEVGIAIGPKSVSLTVGVAAPGTFALETSDDLKAWTRCEGWTVAPARFFRVRRIGD